jgi:hypothetical protein
MIIKVPNDHRHFTRQALEYYPTQTPSTGTERKERSGYISEPKAVQIKYVTSHNDPDDGDDYASRTSSSAFMVNLGPKQRLRKSFELLQDRFTSFI